MECVKVLAAIVLFDAFVHLPFTEAEATYGLVTKQFSTDFAFLGALLILAGKPIERHN